MTETKKQNDKIIKMINQKIKDTQILLMLFNIIWYNKEKTQSALVITSKKLYIVNKMTIKKYFEAELIQSLILTPFSRQLLIFYNQGQNVKKQNVRVQSSENVKIVQYIITVREKFQCMKEKLNVLVTLAQNLQHFSKNNQKKSKNQNKESQVTSNQEYFKVSSNDFILLIGQRMYTYVFHNTKLLYANNNETFRFEEERFNVKQIGPQKNLFKTKQSENNKKAQKIISVVQRKIPKLSNSQNYQQDTKITEYLKNYKNYQYKQELLYALQSQTHFTILTNLHEQEKNCQELLLEHHYFFEENLKNIFLKLLQMIENNHLIFHSLTPQNIILIKDDIKISQLFSFIKHQTQIDYISPQELLRETFTQNQIQLINLWKVGVLIFELAYGNVPFPLQFIAHKLITNNKLQIKFPSHQPRSNSFQTFISSILKINAHQRGISINSQQQINNSKNTNNNNTLIINNNNNDNNNNDWKKKLRNSVWIKGS